MLNFFFFLLHHEGTVRSFGKLSRYFSSALPTPFQCTTCKLFAVYTHSKLPMSGYGLFVWFVLLFNSLIVGITSFKVLIF